MRARAQITSASLDLRYGEEVDVDPDDPVWADAFRDGFLVPLDDTVLGAHVPDEEWKPGAGDTVTEADAPAPKKAPATKKAAKKAEADPPDEDPPES